MEDKTYISVWVTATGRFRAHIEEPHKPAYEVTVGLKEWREGKGRKYEGRIKAKCERIILKLQSEHLNNFK